MLPKNSGTELRKPFATDSDDVGLGEAEAHMVAIGPKLSSGEASANNNFRAVRDGKIGRITGSIDLPKIANKTQRKSKNVQNLGNS